MDDWMIQLKEVASFVEKIKFHVQNPENKDYPLLIYKKPQVDFHIL